MGGFSRALDLLASEYGWHDTEILSLPVCRLRQITGAIVERRLEEVRARASFIEWQTRTLAGYIAATIPTGGKKNPLLDSAGKIRLRVGADSEEEDDNDDDRTASANDRPGSADALLQMVAGLGMT